MNIMQKLDKDNLIWIDLEMTGLDTVTDHIIEIATIVTDKELNILEEGPVIAIHQSQAIMDGMDEWNQTHHGQNGLIDRVKSSQYNDEMAEKETLEFLSQYVESGFSPMCGNSICQDRRFLARCMPDLERFFHYRNLDVSSLKIVANLWKPELLDQFTKQNTHKALDDIRESIEELKFYRANMLNL